MFKQFIEDVQGINDNLDGTDESNRDAYTYAENIRKDVVSLRKELALIFEEANRLGAGHELKSVRVVVYKPKASTVDKFSTK